MTVITGQQKFSINNLLRGIKASLFSRPTRLQFFYDLVGSKSISTMHNRGTQEVKLSQIVGSMNAARCQDFDAQFNMISVHSQSRLAGVEKAWATKNLAPISLIQLENSFFVQDGHHRVSIALGKGQELIKANVTVVMLSENDATNGLTLLTI